jgi:hypothetical protein
MKNKELGIIERRSGRNATNRFTEFKSGKEKLVNSAIRWLFLGVWGKAPALLDWANIFLSTPFVKFITVVNQFQ